MRRAAGWAAIGLGVLAWRSAAADGARGVGAAGAVIASVDDETALALNPAGLARAVGVRLTGAIGVVRAFGETSGADDRGGGTWSGTLGLSVPIGETVVIGASLVWPTAIERAYPRPLGEWNPATDDRAEAPGRYAGTALSLDERGILAGVAVRARPWLAIGGAVGALRVDVASERVLWGGDATGIDDPADLSPALDLGFSAGGADGFVPTASLGVLAAPDGVPLELGLGLRWGGGVEITGRAELAESRDGTLVPGPASAAATLELPGRAGLAVGVRFLAPRGAVELGGEIVWLTGEREPAWDARGIRVGGAALAPVPVGPRFSRTQGALRVAGDIDLLRGLLTLTVAGAWERGPVARSSIGPLTPSADAWVVSAGIGARAERARLTFGIAQRIADDAHLGEALRVQGRTGPTGVVAATGMVSGGTTTFVMGLTIDFP